MSFPSPGCLAEAYKDFRSEIKYLSLTDVSLLLIEPEE